MDQKHFRSILKKYQQGQATAEEEKMIDSWYENMGKYLHSAFDGSEESELEQKHWFKISSHIRQGRREGIQKRMLPWYSLGIAASVLIALFSYLYVVSYQAEKENTIASVGEDVLKPEHITNSGVTPHLIVLPDESKITLQPNSQLTYAARFDGIERAVFLEGEAFFEITRDLKRPFLVYTKNVATKVLGTSFTVKAFQKEKNVIVEVKTGKVSVYTYDEAKEENAKTPEIILTPNQKIVYDKEENTLSRMFVTKPQAIVPPEELKRMRFEGAPVKEIFEAIEKVYGVDLIYDEASISACTLTTSISDGDIFNRLDIICVAIGASYELREDHILIRGAGCNNQ
jgi:transmembrane sensor